MTEHDRWDTLSEEEDDTGFLFEKNAKVEKYRLYTRKFDPQYLKYGFVFGGDVINRESTGDALSNDATKPSKFKVQFVNY